MLYKETRSHAMPILWGSNVIDSHGAIQLMLNPWISTSV